MNEKKERKKEEKRKKEKKERKKDRMDDKRMNDKWVDGWIKFIFLRGQTGTEEALINEQLKANYYVIGL